MVTPNAYLKDIADSGKIITLTTSEAIKHKYCNGEASSIEDVLKQTGAVNAERVHQQLTWVDRIIALLLSPVVNSILLLLILGGIYFELQHPGIGFALVVAITASLLYFAPLYLEGLAANWEILIFILGIGLLVVEIFVLPGFGIAGVTGIVLMVAGLTLSLVSNHFFDFTFTPVNTIFYSLLRVALIFAFVMVGAVTFGGRLFNTKLMRNVILTDTQENQQAYVANTSSLKALVGKQATAETVLRPSGMINVDGEKYDAITDGAFINKGETAMVVEVRGNYLVVR
jgi:membrane-bound serine protease (ClpP class)